MQGRTVMSTVIWILRSIVSLPPLKWFHVNSYERKYLRLFAADGWNVKHCKRFDELIQDIMFTQQSNHPYGTRENWEIVPRTVQVSQPIWPYHGVILPLSGRVVIAHSIYLLQWMQIYASWVTWHQLKNQVQKEKKGKKKTFAPNSSGTARS